MGVAFRSGSYTRFVRVGGRTIKDGEAAVVWNTKGVATQYVGPMRISLWYSTIRFLDRFKAEAAQYLEVKHRDGSVQHIPGPVSMYMNPAVHDSIVVQDGVELQSKDDCIVVFSPKTHDNKLNAMSEKESTPERRVVYGPTIHFPAPHEKIHKFAWNQQCSDLAYPSQGKHIFGKLSTSKVYTWRVQLTMKTAEFNKVPVTLAISYQVESVTKCLAVENPIQMIETALATDTHSSVGGPEKNTLEWITKESTYPALCETMGIVGFRLLKIQVLNIQPSFEVRQEVIKEKRKSQMEDTSKINHMVETATRMNSTKLEYLNNLKELGVDLTQVLVASRGRLDWLGPSSDKTTEKQKSPERMTIAANID